MSPEDALAQWLPADASEARALKSALAALAQTRGLTLPEPPPEPENCCGNGCIGCVWEGYGQELAWWRDEVLASWGR